LAIYHCSVKVISRSQGRSATGAAAYRSGEKITDERTGLVHDYTRKSGIDYADILAPIDAPSWVHDRSTLWNEVELIEKRKDSQVCREVEVALPVELTSEENQKLVRGFINNEFVQNGMVADLAIHHAKGENPHGHILLTTRTMSADGFGQKNRDWNKKELLETWRKSWETHTNLALEKAGHKQKIDHRTLEAQGIERIPQIHIGPKVCEMEKRGIRTDIGQKASDIFDANEKIISLQKHKEAIEHERTLDIEKIQNNRRAGESDRTTCPSVNEPGRSDDGATRTTAKSQRDPLRELDSSADEHSQSVGDSRTGSQSNSASADQCSQPSNQRHTSWFAEHGVDQSVDFDTASDGAYDRILDLSRPANRHTRREHMAQFQDKPLDRSYLAVRRQLKAMGCETYEVGIRSRDGRMMSRTWTSDEVLKSVSWLKRENAKGADIYVRPAGDKNQGIVLVDDVNQSQLEKMKSKGYEPATVVETSPQNYQAWVRISKDPIEPELATAISKGMAKHFEADENSADWRHYGRLAGFTNRKPEHTTAQGRNPWVLCHESSGKHASRGDETVQTISKQVEEFKVEKEQQTRLEQAINARQGASRSNPIQTYQNQLKSLIKRFGADLDLSRADYTICSSMAKSGYSKDQLVKTLEQASPELVNRKASHELDYCTRTVEAAFKNPQVQAHLNSEQENTKSKSRGFSR